MDDLKHNFLSTVKEFQKCQRNFDLEKTIDDETIEWLISVGYNTPTKQNLDTFDIVCIKDRSLINKFSQAAASPIDELSPELINELNQGRIQNPQTNSNLLFLFFINPDSVENPLRKRREGGYTKKAEYLEKTTNLEIGLSASAIGIAAHSIGLKTGFCRCIDHSQLPKDLLKYNIEPNNLVIMLGIGYPLFDNHTIHTDGKFYSTSYKKIPKKYHII